MDRRTFIGTVASVLVALPAPAGAQRAAKAPRIGILTGAASGSPGSTLGAVLKQHCKNSATWKERQSRMSIGRPTAG